MNFKQIFSSEFKNPAIPKKLFKISAIIALFFLAFKAPLDPDLFWHIKTGELMWQYATIPKIDWYSFTMSDFAWINHEWLTQIIMFKIKNAFGWMGLSIFFASIITFTFGWLIPSSARNLKTQKYPFYMGLLLSILGALTSSLVFGIRPQILSLFGTALIFYIINQYQLNNKSKIIYFLPLMFLFWVNMHASFILGLVLLGVYLVLDKSLSLPASRHPDAEWLKLYRPLSADAWKNLGLMTLLSAIATLFNPYGARIYEEIFRTFSDSYGHNIIIEWLSPNFHNVEGVMFGFYIIFIFIIISIVKKIDMLSFVLFPFSLFLALQAGRNIPTFVIISVPLLIRNLEGFEEIFSSIMQKKAVALSLCFLLVFYPPYMNETKDVIKTLFNETEMAKSGDFPQKEALKFLKNYRAKNPGNMLNDYFWGGYLIANSEWRMINGKIEGDSKVFIDGRMAHWIKPDRHILKDYVEMIDLKSNTDELLNKYKIQAIFIRKDSLLGRAFSFNNEWNKIYEDELAVIYEKK